MHLLRAEETPLLLYCVSQVNFSCFKRCLAILFENKTKILIKIYFCNVQKSKYDDINNEDPFKTIYKDSCVIHKYVSIPAKPFIPCGPTTFAPGEPFSPGIPLRPTSQSQKYLHNVIQNFNKSTNVSNDNHQVFAQQIASPKK